MTATPQADENVSPRTAAGRRAALQPPGSLDEWEQTILAIEAEARQQDASAQRAALERLAALEHEQWAQWAATLLTMEPGISEARRTRWQRLIATPYADLTEAEKHEDRVWAEKVLAAQDHSPEPER